MSTPIEQGEGGCEQSYMCTYGGSDVNKSACNADLGLIPGLERLPWRREWLSTQVFLPGELHGERNMAGYGKHSISFIKRLKLK